VSVRHIAQIALVCAPQLVIAKRSAGAPNGGAVRVSKEQSMSQKVTLSWAAMGRAARTLLERGHAVRAAR
jgi:hypothetical protein